MVAIVSVPSQPVQGVTVYLWETLTESDTGASQLIGGTQTLHGSFQVIGTFGSATVVLQESNDNSTWVTVQDLEGADISFANATGLLNFSSASAYFRPFASGGTGQDVDCRLSVRG